MKLTESQEMCGVFWLKKATIGKPRDQSWAWQSRKKDQIGMPCMHTCCAFDEKPEI